MFKRIGFRFRRSIADTHWLAFRYVAFRCSCYTYNICNSFRVSSLHFTSSLHVIISSVSKAVSECRQCIKTLRCVAAYTISPDKLITDCNYGFKYRNFYCLLSVTIANADPGLGELCATTEGAENPILPPPEMPVPNSHTVRLANTAAAFMM